MTRVEHALTSVNGCASVVELELLVAKADLLQLNLPVGLPPYRDVLDLARVRAIIDASENGLTTILFRVTETEGEDGRIKESLVDERVEGRHDVVNRDGVIAKTEDTVEPKAVESGNQWGKFTTLTFQRQRRDQAPW